jgi:hypothetical protein
VGFAAKVHDIRPEKRDDWPGLRWRATRMGKKPAAVLRQREEAPLTVIRIAKALIALQTALIIAQNRAVT